jgi:hypothetical protein
MNMLQYLSRTIATLLLVCFTCFSNTSFSQSRSENTVTFHGNKFEMSKAVLDTMEVEDPVSGQIKKVVRQRAPIPVKMNGAKIYGAGEVSALPLFDGHTKSLSKLILERLESQLEKLPDGEYVFNLGNMVADVTGKIVYYEYKGIKRRDIGNDRNEPADVQKEIGAKVIELLASVQATSPATLNGKNVPAAIDEPGHFNLFMIRNGKLLIL